MLTGFKLLFRHRRILWATTLNDIKGRYAGTTFGLAWTVLYPLLFLGLYAVVYIVIFQIRVGQMSTFGYVLLIFAGLIPFLGFSEALGGAIASVTSNKALLNNTLFPIELIPVKAVFVSSITMLTGLCMLQMILWAQGILYITQLLVPIILILQFIFTLGLMWLLSALNVFFKDLTQMIGVVILFLMLISPIAYTAEMIPPNLLPLMYPNPLYYLIMLYRESMMTGQAPLDLLIVFTAIAFLTFWLGFYFFSRLKQVFADYV